MQKFRKDANLNPNKSEEMSKSVLILKTFHYLCKA